MIANKNSWKSFAEHKLRRWKGESPMDIHV